MKKLLFGLILVSLMAVSAFAETPRSNVDATALNLQLYKQRGTSLMIPDTTMQRLFTGKDIAALGLESVGNFWSGTTIKAIHTYPNKQELLGHPKSIRISVYNSQSTAYLDFEKQRIYCAIAIIPGSNHDVFSSNWWYTKSGMPNAIFVNQGNTIFEVAHSEKPSEEVEGELIAAAKEIVARMKAITAKK